MSFNTGTLINNLAKSKLSNPATADLDLQNTFKIKNSVEPVLNSDLATKNYVDITAGGGGASTGTLPFSLIASSTVIGQFTNPSGNDLQLTAPTTTGKLIFSDIHGVDFTNTPTTFSLPASNSNDVIDITNNGNGYALQTNGTKGDIQINGTTEQNGRIVQSTGGSLDSFSLTHSSGTGDALHITKNGTTGHGLNIENNGSGLAMNATITTATGGILITKNANTGAGIPLQINHTNNFTAGSQPSIDVNHNSNAVGVNIGNSGPTGTMLLTQTGAGYALNVNKVSGSGNCVVVSNSGSGLLASLSSTGTGITYNHTNTGANAGLTYTKSGGTGGRMVDLTYSNSGSDDIVRIDRSSGGGSGNMLNLISTTNGVVINATNSGTASNIVLTNSANSGSSPNANFVKTGTGNGDNVVIRNTDTVGASTGNALSILNQGVGDCLRIQDEAGDTSLFRVDGDGNVGIGVPTTALSNKFESNAGSGTTTTQIAQSTTTNALIVSDSSVGSSRIDLNTTGTRITGRSDIILEPSRGTSSLDTTPRIRMTIASGSNNGILLQGNNATAGSNFRFGFTSGSTADTTMNVYSDIATRRVRVGQQDIFSGIPTGVMEITRNATPHGTSIPHILLNGTNATGGVVMNCNAGRIENVADPTNPQDVATRAYVLANVGTPTQIATGQNKFQTSASGINQQADAGQSMNMGINNNGQKNIQSYGPNVLINVPSGTTTNDTQVMEAWSSETGGAYSTSSSFLGFAIKPRVNNAFVGRFNGADIQNVGPTIGVFHIYKNSGTHGTGSHIRLVGTDSPYNPLTAVAINVNNTGRIVNCEPPAGAKDVLTANDVGNVNVSSGTIIKLCDYTQPLISTPMITRFTNSGGSFGVSATNPYGIYYLLNTNAGNTAMGFTTGLGTCPISYNYLTTNITPADTVGCFQLLKNGTYRINVNIQVGTVAGGSVGTDFINLTVYQGNSLGTYPPNIICPTTNQFYLGSFDRFRTTGHNLNMTFSFFIRRQNGVYFTFGTDSAYGPLVWSGLNVETNRMEVLCEYLGLDYV
jgi:hypothetical protein